MKKGINLVDKKGSEAISKAIKDEVAKNEMVEIREPLNVSVILRRAKIPVPDYIMYFEEANKYLMKNISAIGCKVYMLLMAKANYGNMVTCHQLTMSEEMKYSVKHIERGISELVKDKIIIKVKSQEDHRLNSYIINPYLVWKGSVSEMKKTQRTLYKNQIAIPGFPAPGDNGDHQDKKTKEQDRAEFKKIISDIGEQIAKEEREGKYDR